ncbi:MAG: ATP12 family protein, partial [Paracoccaceae bacterium]
MSEWAPKVFWTTVETLAVEGGHTVVLDGRRIKTPAKAALTVPTQGLAQAIAKEWAAQSETVTPATMPFTRTANAAIDKVTLQRAEVADMLSAYGDSDLLCYRAPGPDDLVAQQAVAWDPLLDWAAERYGARLDARSGVIHVAQSPDALA